MRHLSKSGIVTLQALGGPIGSRTAQVQEQQLEETKFIAFFMGKKIDIEGKDLYDAKQKAITQLKVPKSKVGLLAVVSAESQKNQDFKFEYVTEGIENVANGLPQTMGKQKSLKREALKSIVKEVMQEEAEYQKFFQKVLDKAGKSIPSMSDDEKKAFFNKVDAAWSARGEKTESVNEADTDIKVGDMVKVDNPHWEGALGKNGPFKRKVKMIDHDNVFFTDGSNSSMKYIKK
jgi:hypothetical protein